MADSPFQRLRHFLRELKRRNVYRVAATYAVVAFITLQAARLIFPATTLEGVYDVLVVIAFVGFPLALVVAWAFEMTPEGVRRTPQVEPAEETATEAGQGFSTGYKVLVGLGLLAAAVAGGWYLTGGSDGDPSAGTASSVDSAAVSARSIAVLPFSALSEGEESQTFARGIHDDLLTRLAHISELRVISRTAVQQYRNTDLTTGQIADSLDVRWIMEGGVQVLGDQIQVNAQLINPRTEAHTWADSYQRDLTTDDLFALQGEITRRIARSLEAQLTPEERERVERRPTGDLDAYRLYVQGRSRLDTRTEEGMRDAVDYFRRAIEEDSSYALAWSGLADAVGILHSRPYTSPAESLPDYEQSARRALELAPDLAEPHASMGLVYIHEGNGPAALRELRRAVAITPSYAEAHQWLGNTLLSVGRPDQARSHLELAVELNPSHAAARLGFVYALIATGAEEKALGQARLYQAPVPGYGAYVRALALYHVKRWDALGQLTRKGLDAEHATPAMRFYLTRLSVLRGDTAGARAHLEALREREGADFFTPLHEGLAYAALGEYEAAFEAWRSIDPRHELLLLSLRYFYSDILDPLREDSRYKELIREANRTWGLNPDGSLPDSVDVSFKSESDE